MRMVSRLMVALMGETLCKVATSTLKYICVMIGQKRPRYPPCGRFATKPSSRIPLESSFVTTTLPSDFVPVMLLMAMVTSNLATEWKTKEGTRGCSCNEAGTKPDLCLCKADQLS